MQGSEPEVKLSNAPLIGRLLKHFRMNLYKLAPTSFEPGLDLSKASSSTLTDRVTCRQLGRASMHLASTSRPDIACAAYYLARFMHTPSEGL